MGINRDEKRHRLFKSETYASALFTENRQTVLFSATIDSQVENLARLALRSDPVHVLVADEIQSTVTGLHQG